MLLLSSKIRRRACLFSNSNFRAFPAPQKYHTSLHYGDRHMKSTGSESKAFQRRNSRLSQAGRTGEPFQIEMIQTAIFSCT